MKQELYELIAYLIKNNIGFYIGNKQIFIYKLETEQLKFLNNFYELKLLNKRILIDIGVYYD